MIWDLGHEDWLLFDRVLNTALVMFEHILNMDILSISCVKNIQVNATRTHQRFVKLDSVNGLMMASSH